MKKTRGMLRLFCVEKGSNQPADRRATAGKD